MSRPRIAIGAAVAASLAFAGAASAGTVQMSFLGTGQGRSVKINVSGDTENVFAGQLRHQITSGVGDGAGLVGTWITFCTDLHEFVSSSTKTYNVVGVKDIPAPAMGDDKAHAIEDMYRYANGNQFLTSGNEDFAAAFQMAVWEVVTDFTIIGGRSSLSVAAGDFKATKTDGSLLSLTIRNFLDGLFDSIGSFSLGSGPNFQLIGLARSGSQDQIIQTPLPTPAVLGLAGLAGGLTLRRRRLA